MPLTLPGGLRQLKTRFGGPRGKPQQWTPHRPKPPGGRILRHPFLPLRFLRGTARFLPELYVVILMFVDVVAHRARRGLPRRSARPGAPLVGSSAPRGAEDMMINIFGFQMEAPPWQL